MKPTGYSLTKGKTKHQFFFSLLENTFREPELAFIQVSRRDRFFLRKFFRRYYLFLFSLLLFASTVKHTLTFRSYFYLFKKGLLEPLIISLGFLIFLYILSIIIDESANYFGKKHRSDTGAKICFLSAMPGLGILLFTFLPVFGNFFFALALGNWVYLMWVGSKTLLFFPGTRLTPWVMTVFITSLLLGFLGLIGLNLFLRFV